MCPRSGQIRAIGRTIDFHQPLRAAADRTDLLSKGWTGAFRSPLAADRADHLRKLAHWMRRLCGSSVLKRRLCHAVSLKRTVVSSLAANDQRMNGTAGM